MRTGTRLQKKSPTPFPHYQSLRSRFSLQPTYIAKQESVYEFFCLSEGSFFFFSLPVDHGQYGSRRGSSSSLQVCFFVSCYTRLNFPLLQKKKTTQKRHCTCTKMRSGAWCAVCCKDESHVTVESSVLAVDDEPRGEPDAYVQTDIAADQRPAVVA